MLLSNFSIEQNHPEVLWTQIPGHTPETLLQHSIPILSKHARDANAVGPWMTMLAATMADVTISQVLLSKVSNPKTEKNVCILKCIYLSSLQGQRGWGKERNTTDQEQKLP